MKIQRILFPTDFSESGQAAEQTACDFAVQFGSELHVLEEFILSMPQTAAALALPTNAIEEMVRGSEESLHNLPFVSRLSGPKIVRAVRVGSTYDTILQYARENEIDLIVIGTHGRTGLPHVLLGSVAERVVQHANCLVLTVRSGGPRKLKGIAEDREPATYFGQFPTSAKENWPLVTP